MKEIRIIAFAGVCCCLIIACATAKTVLRTINDAGMILCQIYAAEPTEEGAPAPAELAGLTPEEFCAIAENVQPFIEEALAAKQEAGRRSLARREAEEE